MAAVIPLPTDRNPVRTRTQIVPIMAGYTPDFSGNLEGGFMRKSRVRYGNPEAVML
jgi:hypothetical protein